MDAIEELLAIEDIKKLKSRYLQSIDLKDQGLYRSLMTDDLTFEESSSIADPVTDYSPYPDPMAGGPIIGLDNCARALFAALAHPDLSSVHIAHMPDITFIDADNAAAIWTMSDIVNFPGADGVMTLMGYGYYHDRFRRVDGRWKFTSIYLKRSRIDYPYEQAWRDKTRLGKAPAMRFEIDGLTTNPLLRTK